MEGLHDDLFMQDVQTMPTVDPTVEAKLQKEFEKAEKARLAAEKREGKKEALAPAKRAPPKPKDVKDTVVDDVRRREIKCHKIRLYFAKLGHLLTLECPASLPKTDAGIDQLLAAVEAELHSNGGIEKAGMFYVTAVTSVEQITQVFNPLGWQLSGPVANLSQTVAANRKQWEDLVTEFAISNAEYFMVGPGKRLIATTVQLILAVDAANKSALGRQAVAPQEMQKEAEEL